MSQDNESFSPPMKVLRSGRVVQVLDEVKALTISTKCPAKWVCVDLETGEAFMGSKTGWRRATNAAIKDTINALRIN